MSKPFRTHSIGTKVTAEEYEQLESCAHAKNLSISEWSRGVLLDAANFGPVLAGEQAILAEVIALRTILLNLHFTVAKGEPITADYMQTIIDRADASKVQKAIDRLSQKKID